MSLSLSLSLSKLESVQYVKDLGVTISTNLKFSQQCKDAAGKANRMLGFINRNFSFKSKDIILPLYISLVRPHLEYAVQFWSPHHAKDIAKLEAVQRTATKIIASHTKRGWRDSTFYLLISITTFQPFFILFSSSCILLHNISCCDFLSAKPMNSRQQHFIDGL